LHSKKILKRGQKGTSNNFQWVEREDQNHPESKTRAGGRATLNGVGGGMYQDIEYHDHGDVVRLFAKGRSGERERKK